MNNCPTRKMEAPLTVTRKSFEYDIAQKFLEGKSSLVGDVSLIDTLEAGLAVLDKLSTWPTSMKAYCLRPLLQDDHSFEEGWKTVCRNGVQPRALVLAMEFRRIANSFLPSPYTDRWTIAKIKLRVGLIIPPVRLMLIAHKAVGYRQFLQHAGRHARHRELAVYFEKWFVLLDVTKQEILALTEDLSNA